MLCNPKHSGHKRYVKMKDMAEKESFQIKGNKENITRAEWGRSLSQAAPLFITYYTYKTNTSTWSIARKQNQSRMELQSTEQQSIPGTIEQNRGRTDNQSITEQSNP